ncbi:MAG TPA: isoleucine--tRNA ligase [Candidatus Saccharimonadales bacterium]|nr:isoleucine--tRNA ligase [Candidatus Saccharimonadales bacterium]
MANQPKKHFLAEIEEQLLEQWETDHTFERSLKNREGAEVFSFYDGPPFANGTPHYGHLLQTTIKDTVTRYKTMRGYYVPRRVGWDTHGLPVEYAIEKEHGFRGKQDIVAYGIDKFNAECRESVFKYKDIWENMFRRVGRWADYEHTYATLDESYIESVWNVFQTIYDKGLVYKDFRSAPYCPRCATPLSNFELNQGYQDNVEDPSLFVKFKLTDEDAYLLGWTTTPWSLPGNAAIAVKPDAEYVYVELSDDEGQSETVILARNRLEALNVDTYTITKELYGRDLVGKSYEPLFDLANLDQYDNRDNLYKVWPAEFVSIDDGSGVLHVAPAFGEDDLRLGRENDLPVILSVDDNGKIKTDMGLPESLAGKFFKSADDPIIAYLTHRNRVYAAETFKHTYPFCWRCDTPLLYYATDSWLVKVTDVKDDLVKNNNKINWVPEHIKEGRFGNWLSGARDWAISRNRFWGAPLPVWVTDDGEVTVIGSVEELRRKAVNPDKIADLHRPYIDDVEIKTESGKIARRIPEVFDCWFESGSMPYAQDHYPFENKEQWEQRFPADFIAEAIDQTRGWFYTLHVLASALFDKPAFQNVICSGWIVAADGEKLSKRKKNYAPMDDIFDQYGVDSMRFFMASSPLVNGEDTRFSTDFLRDVQRKIFMTLNNIFSFYKLYADVDGYKPSEPLKEPHSDNILDQWMLSRLSEAIGEVTKAMDEYRLDRAARPIQDLLDDASNWYVRRSRRRFWKSEDDTDKNQAYATLHYTLLRLCQLLAPFSPFLPDHLWQQLVEGTDLPKSVHLSDWPKAGEINRQLLDEMARARSFIVEGLAQRAAMKVKVRQPLKSVLIPELPEIYSPIIAEELNVKEVMWGSFATNGTPQQVTLNTTITPELKAEGLMREIVRHVQKARKDAGLEVDNRISLQLESDDTELQAVLKDHTLTDTIKQETLATNFGETVENGYETTVKIDGAELTIKLSKA